MNLQLVYRYVLSPSKSENMFYIKTKQNKTKQKDQKKGGGGGKFPTAGVESQTSKV